MALPPGFVEELRSRVSLAQVVGRKVTWDPRKTQRRPRRLLGALPVPPGKDRLVPRRRGQGLLLLLRLPRQGRRGQLPARDREPRLHGGGRAPRRARPAWRCRRATRPPPRAPPRTRASSRRWRRRSASTALQLARRPRRRGPRLPRPPRPGAADPRPLRDRLSPPTARTALLDHLTGKGFPRESLVEAGLVGLPARRRQPLRPLPRPDHVPDPRRAAAAPSPSAPARSPPGRSRST